MLGTILTGYLSTIISPRIVLMGIYGLRAVLIVIVVFIPISVTTVMIFSVFFGVNLLFNIIKKKKRIKKLTRFYSSCGYQLFLLQLNL